MRVAKFTTYSVCSVAASRTPRRDRLRPRNRRPPGRNRQLEAAALAVAGTLRRCEAGDADWAELETAVRRVLISIGDLPATCSAAIDEFLDAFATPDLAPEAVAELPHFGALFGRETLYLSFEKR